MIRVVDLFAGPGGLGEGFSSWRDARGAHRFEIAISVEMDVFAHATLRLRALRRSFGDEAPDSYDLAVAEAAPWSALADRFPTEAARAEAEAVRIELGAREVVRVRSLIKQIIPADGGWMLVGGPPCQAYSLVGRARNRGNEHYRPSRDRRHQLYVEYLQILSDHAPPVFVMENVKGLLSARVHRSSMFDRIEEDLRDPSVALRREGRTVGNGRARYDLFPLVQREGVSPSAASRFVIRSEEHGIPQRRHRVILVGIRSDLPKLESTLIPSESRIAVGEALAGLPRLRSGLSSALDSGAAWLECVRSAQSAGWVKEVDGALADRIRALAGGISVPRADRGAEYLPRRSGPPILNHATRGHMASDLHRYLFASAFALARGMSPSLRDFPKSLLPAHLNVRAALEGGLFADRFRVQVKSQPSTTVASHISKDGHYYIHPDPTQCRSLTVREAARLQTFPDDYFFCGPRTAQYHQVGNAVPPMLAQQIAGIVAGLF